MSLSIVIPVHDDADNLRRLLGELARLAPAEQVLAEQVIVIDDGSTVALDAAALCNASGFDPARLLLRRQAPARGPGAARNRALEMVTATHVMFLDADDLPTRDLPDLIADLAGQDFDFCLFQHHDTRSEQELRWGQMPWDQALWVAAGVDLGALSEVSDTAGPLLARTANYPWNKIYRTGFLRAHGIGCTEILVHEDVELHWRCFLNARRILASDRVVVIHQVADDGTRLTNRAGPERLAVFEPLHALLTEADTSAYGPAFVQFALGLIAWIADNLDPAHHAALRDQARAFLARALPADQDARLQREDPALMARLTALLDP